MRQGIMACGITVLLFVHVAPAAGQFSFDARRIGMAGVNLGRGGTLSRYNAAYRAVPARERGANPSLTIPLPLGLIQFFQDHPIGQLGDDPAFNPESTAFNPVELLDLVFHPPLYYEVKAVTAPVNDVEFTIGRNELILDLGNTQRVIPADEFGLGGSNRLLDIGFRIAGFRVGVTGWMQYEVGFSLDDSLLAVLKQADSVRPNTRYNVLGDAIGQGGLAPTIGYAGRIVGDSAGGLYLGAAVRYYLGRAYGSSAGTGGFRTGNPIFNDSAPATPVLDALGRYSKFGNALGRGIGVDVGVVWVSGPLELGLGVNDIGAKLTWSDTRVDSVAYVDVTTPGVDDSLVSIKLADHVETMTTLPLSYVANVAYSVGAVTFGGTILNGGRGTSVQLGAEKRFGPLALRGGVARDQR
ncbi:MAG: hypothetical protein ACREMG_12745, partial [Gemmatimonadales bacterium]